MNKSEIQAEIAEGYELIQRLKQVSAQNPGNEIELNWGIGAIESKIGELKRVALESGITLDD